jgi:hypothetical protein
MWATRRRVEQSKTVKATESDEVESYYFLEPFQPKRHGPMIAHNDPLIAMRPR